MWFTHTKNKVLSAVEVGGTERGVKAMKFVVEKDGKRSKILILQHWVFFCPQDFKEPEDGADINHFVIPANDLVYTNFDHDDHHAILCFNSSRTYAVYVAANCWNFANQLEGGKKLIHRDDCLVIACPWRIWALDVLPEWLQRGWPNPVNGYCGEVGNRASWEFHPNWSVEAMKAAEGCKRLPTNPDEAPDFFDWRAKGFYRAWLEDPDDMLLPWYEEGHEPKTEPKIEGPKMNADFRKAVDAAMIEIKAKGITPIKKLVRPNAPLPSHEAAMRIEQEVLELEAIYLCIVRHFADKGCIADEVQKVYGTMFPNRNANKNTTARSSALKSKGFIVVDGKRKGFIKGGQQGVMYAKEFAPKKKEEAGLF